MAAKQEEEEAMADRQKMNRIKRIIAGRSLLPEKLDDIYEVINPHALSRPIFATSWPRRREGKKD